MRSVWYKQTENGEVSSLQKLVFLYTELLSKFSCEKEMKFLVITILYFWDNFGVCIFFFPLSELPGVTVHISKVQVHIWLVPQECLKLATYFIFIQMLYPALLPWSSLTSTQMCNYLIYDWLCLSHLEVWSFAKICLTQMFTGRILASKEHSSLITPTNWDINAQRIHSIGGKIVKSIHKLVIFLS